MVHPNHSRFEEPHDDGTPQGRDEATESNRVGQKTGGQQQCAGHQQENALDDCDRRDLASIHVPSHLSDRRESLCANEGGAGNRRQHHEADGRDRADDPADLEQEVDLDERYCDEQQEEDVKDVHLHTLSATGRVATMVAAHGTP